MESATGPISAPGTILKLSNAVTIYYTVEKVANTIIGGQVLFI